MRKNSPRATSNMGKNIDVPQKVIDFALQNNSGHCVAADAIKLAMPYARNVCVDIQTIRWSDPRKGLRYMALTPRQVQVYILNWDQGLVPLPFSFRLRSAQIVRMKKTLSLERSPTKRKYGSRKVTVADIPKKATLEVKVNSKAGKEAGIKLGGKLPPVTKGLRREFGVRDYRIGEGAVPAKAFGTGNFQAKKKVGT